LPRSVSFIISPEYDKQTVYYFLKYQAKLSASLIRTLKHVPDGILLRGAHARTVDPLCTGDCLCVNFPADKSVIEARDIPLDVLFEDDGLLAVNKPPFLAMHPSHNHQGDTLANAVAFYLAKSGKAAAFRCVGRLDKNTSGVAVCALNPFTAAKLSGKIKKEYLAIATGIFKEPGMIDAPIFRPDPILTMRTVDGRGKRAVTHFETLENFDGMSLLKIWPETGRTHQIRVHFAHLGAPLLGDFMYGEHSGRMNRHALHCAAASFSHPVSGKTRTVCAPLPADMANLLKSQNIFL
jgi:23S rRNA pseudouridine1911/1915/1917 synthase